LLPFVTIPARSCPKTPRLARPPWASPQANAGRTWLAGELAWQAGWRSGFVISPLKIGIRGFSQRTNYWEGAKKNFNLKTQVVYARIRQ